MPILTRAIDFVTLGSDHPLRRRIGRRNHYISQSHLPVPDPLARGQRVGDLLAILAGNDSPGPRR